MSENLALVQNTSDALIQLSENKNVLNSPTVQLSGHSDAVYTIAFSPSGNYLASGSKDSQILLWETFGENKNYNTLSGHKNAVLELKWITENAIVSSSADKTVSLWDANKGVRIRKYTYHTEIVNTCSVAQQESHLFLSGSDDGYIVLYDTRCKDAIYELDTTYPVLTTSMASDGQSFYYAGIENIIYKWDMRNISNMTTTPEDSMKIDPTSSSQLHGHTDTITGIAISPDNTHLLSMSMDNHLYNWDVKPFCLNETARCEKEYIGAIQNSEKNLLRCTWSSDQEYIACGSSDRITKIWNATSAKLVYYLPGHKGSVNEVIFHPHNSSIIASCSTDRTILLGSLS